MPVVLGRILDHTTGEIRATGYVLAVYPQPHSQLQVHHHGIDAAQAESLARRAFADELQGEDVLVAPVVSSRRDYGRLVVASAGGHGFFEQERESLALYAKLAAAVLDVATALEDRDRRNAQVNALLGLAHALARAGTSVEAARGRGRGGRRLRRLEHLAVVRRRARAAAGGPLAQRGRRAGRRALGDLTISCRRTRPTSSLLGDPRRPSSSARAPRASSRA